MPASGPAPGSASSGSAGRPAGSTSSAVTKHRADRQERVRALGPQPLAVALLAGRERLPCALPVAGADVVDDHVAGDVGRGILGRDPPGPPPDDDAELDLEVEGVRPLRAHDRLAVADDRVGELGEQERPLRRATATLAGHAPR